MQLLKIDQRLRCGLSNNNNIGPLSNNRKRS